MEAEKARKYCSVYVFLFGKPAWEIDMEGRDFDDAMADELRELGKELAVRLEHASALTKTLLRAGWSGSGTLYDVYFSKDTTLEDAEAELRALGVDMKEITIEEEEWEREE